MRVKILTELPTITAEHFISLGFACRPAYWLQRTGLRTCALPFDWMKNAPLDFIAHSLKHGSADWFADYTDFSDSLTKAHRKVIDNPSGMIALHAFPTGQTVSEYLPTFHKIFDARMARMQKICSTAHKICFVMNRASDTKRADSLNDIISFADQLHEMYPMLSISIIHVIHNNDNKEILEYDIHTWLKIYTITNDDISVRAKETGDPYTYWHGNLDMWDDIMSHCYLTKKRKCWFGLIKKFVPYKQFLCPIEYRLDVKNYGEDGNDMVINASNARIMWPSWFKDATGRGATLHDKSVNGYAEITAVNDGVLKLNFRAPDRRVDGKRFPYWVDYSSIVIDDHEILTAPVATWHDKPFVYEMPVTHGQVVRVKFIQTPHKYTDTELSEFIDFVSQSDEMTPSEIINMRAYLSGGNK